MNDIQQAITDLLETSYSNEDLEFKVRGLRDAIKQSKDPEAVITAFDMDPSFHDAFNSNGKNALENIEAYLDASNEGFWQDYWNHGLIGAIFCHFAYEDLNKLEQKLVGHTNLDTGSLYKKRSIYLPYYKEAERLLDICEGVHRAVETFVNNPEADFKTTVEALKNAGLKITDKGKPINYNSTEWLPGLVSNLVGGPLASMVAWIPIYGQWVILKTAVGANFVQVALRRWISKNGDPIGERGWTIDKLNSARQRAHDLIRKLNQLSAAKKEIKKLEKTEDNKCKIKFITRIIDVQTTALKRFGRGLVAVEENKF